MKLTKMHGLGNDFILFADPKGTEKDYTDLAIRLCDRRTGIGADGLAILVPSETCDVRMRIINSDGSEAEMCGNAIRCFAKYAYEHGEITKETFTIETLAGVMKPTLTIENGIVTQVTVDMGKPFFKSQDIPMNVDMDKVIDVDLDVNGETITVSSVLLGVPHTEVFIDDITKAPVTTQGPILEKHDAFPSNTNVNYIEVINDKHIKVRTWERRRRCYISMWYRLLRLCRYVLRKRLNRPRSRRGTVFRNITYFILGGWHGAYDRPC